MLMSEVIKVVMTSNTEEETWSWEARDVLLDTWTAILMVELFETITLFPLALILFHQIENQNFEACLVLVITLNYIYCSFQPINTINVNALLPSEGIKAAADLFGFIVECELRCKTHMQFSIMLCPFLLYYLLSFSLRTLLSYYDVNFLFV